MAFLIHLFCSPHFFNYLCGEEFLNSNYNETTKK